MRLACWEERLLHANVQLLGADAEPHSAASTQRLGLIDLGQSQQLSVEAARFALAPLGSRHLHVIETDDSRHPRLTKSPDVCDGAPNSRSSTRATPASSLDVVTSSAAASNSGWALATATACPAHLSIGRSLGMSPKAMTSSLAIPRSAHTRVSADALLTPAAAISSRLSAEFECDSSARWPTSSLARCSSSSAIRSRWRSINFSDGCETSTSTTSITVSSGTGHRG